MRSRGDDTIVAIATPVGEAGLGVVRLSGPGAVDIAAGLFSSRTFSSAPSHTLHHGWIIRDGARLDEAVASLFRAPASYTGEDVVEFSCHGSPAVLRELVEWCRQAGARLARPGEFTERAFLNGKIDLAQAEAVASLISARSSRAAVTAADQLSGALSKRISGIRQRLIDLLAEIEANLDFAEEDIPNVSRERMAAETSAVRTDIQDLLKTALRGRWLRDGARVALAGRPNVGKSSLFNALLTEDRAIVSDQPGTTRDLLEERLQWHGYPVTLIDTAGLRESADGIEALGADRARRAHAGADVAVLVIDATEGITGPDLEIARRLAGRPVVAALNKTDRGNRCGSDSAKLNAIAVVETSAVTRAGLDALRSAILAAMPSDGGAGEAGAMVTNDRHAERLASALERIDSAQEALGKGRTEEAVSSDLRAAAVELAAITGEDVGEAVLGAIFRRFCIGK